MTTVVDPLGTPTIIFNRLGTAIVSVAATAVDAPEDPAGNDAVVIPHVCGDMIAIVSTHSLANTPEGPPQVDYIVRLPDSEVGDRFEVYCIPDSTASDLLPYQVRVILPSGNSLGISSVVGSGRNDDPYFVVTVGGSAIIRKVSSTNWKVAGAT